MIEKYYRNKTFILEYFCNATAGTGVIVTCALCNPAAEGSTAFSLTQILLSLFPPHVLTGHVWIILYHE